MPPDDGDVLFGLPEQQRVQHPVVYLDGLVLAGRQLVERSAHAGVRDDVGAAVEDDERQRYLGEPRVDVIGHPQQLHHRAQPRPSPVPQRVASGDGALLWHLDGHADEVGGGDDRQFGGESGEEGQDLGHRPPRADALGNPAHRSHQDGSGPRASSRGAAAAVVAQVEEQT